MFLHDFKQVLYYLGREFKLRTYNMTGNRKLNLMKFKEVGEDNVYLLLHEGTREEIFDIARLAEVYQESKRAAAEQANTLPEGDG